MLSAEDAKIQTKKNIEDKIIDELVKVEAWVKEAIERGKFEISTGSLSENAADRLRALGYSVERYASGPNETSIRISWT